MMMDRTLTKPVESIWKSALAMTDMFVSKQDLTELPLNEVEPLFGKCSTTVPMKICALKRLAYHPEEGIVDKLVNVYSAMHSMDASLFIIICGHADAPIEFYLGSRGRGNNSATGVMLQKGFEGNFPGIELEPLGIEAKEELLDRCFPLEYDRKTVVSLSVSPDFRKEKNEKKTEVYLQGIEKFIETMKGQNYTALFLAEPIGREDALEKRKSYENILTELSKCNRMTLGYTEGSSSSVNETLTEGVTETITKSISRTVSSNTSKSIGIAKGKNSGGGFGFLGFSTNRGHNSGITQTEGSGTSEADTDGTVQGEAKNTATSRGTSEITNKGTSYTINVENRRIMDLIDRMEYELKKMDYADSYGMWDAAVYLISEDESTAMIGASSIRSLVLGDESGKAESFINFWGNSSDQFRDFHVDHIMEFLHFGMHPVFRKELIEGEAADIFYFTPAMMVGGNVLPSLMGLPMRSVSGITVIGMPEFGRNIVTDDPGNPGNRKIEIGEILYMGKPEKSKMELYVNSLSEHTFICGAPGSGKSNTVYGLLYALNRMEREPERDMDKAGNAYGGVHFLVIEPAKGEYKYEFSKMPGINLFTTKTNECRMLRLNPFAFPYGSMSVMEQIERLKNIVTACWALTAAMPAILADALEQAYLYAGWDLKNSVYVLPGEVKFPDFRDVLEILPEIINRSGYSSEAKGDYTGALVTRVASLVKGIAGNVFCRTGTIDDKVLFDENTIIDLSSVGSTEARSLIMGVLVMKLENYRRATARSVNYPLRHVTVLEEAHNILPRVSTSQSDESSNVQGKSVEMISNAISEMRTYGEGFIIVDQSPHNVADITISNTSTKIVMRLPGEEDLKTAGASVGLNDMQKTQIPMLARGQAIVKQGNWISPVIAKVKPAPKYYFGRRLPKYDYEELKEVRATLLEKCFKIDERNARRRKIVVSERDMIFSYIDNQLGVAEHQKNIWKEIWQSYCEYNHAQRHKNMPEFVIEVLMFQDGLRICTPKIKELPENLKNPTEEYKGALRDWVDRMEEVLDAYITCDEDLKHTIVYQIMRYCVEFPPSKIHKLCAASVILTYNAGGFT